MKVFIIDLEKCNGCCGCQLACKDEMCDNEWLPYSVPQPDLGHFWMKVNQTEHGQVPKVRVTSLPVMCNHCDSAPCITAAPDAVYKREDGLVIFDPVKVKGNKALVDACPYGVVYWNEELQMPQKCTGCAHLVDNEILPHCVDLCGVGALRFGEEEEFGAEIAQATTLATPDHHARVYYLNDPKLFIGGEVWDPEINEIIEEAFVTLENQEGLHLETRSDDFGDFWFKRLDAGSYKLHIEARGYLSVNRDIELNESTNMGDFPLEKR